MKREKAFARSTEGHLRKKIDLGIAISHFMSVTEGKFSITDPGIATGENIEYIATVTVD